MVRLDSGSLPGPFSFRESVRFYDSISVRIQISVGLLRAGPEAGTVNRPVLLHDRKASVGLRRLLSATPDNIDTFEARHGYPRKTDLMVEIRHSHDTDCFRCVDPYA